MISTWNAMPDLGVFGRTMSHKLTVPHFEHIFSASSWHFSFITLRRYTHRRASLNNINCKRKDVKVRLHYLRSCQCRCSLKATTPAGHLYRTRLAHICKSGAGEVAEVCAPASAVYTVPRKIRDRYIFACNLPNANRFSKFSYHLTRG